MTTDIQFEIHDDGTGQYRITVDGSAAGELTFHTAEGSRVFDHTGVREAYEGQGLAGKLVRRALDDARSEGITIVAECPYVKSYLERHPDDQDLLASAT